MAASAADFALAQGPIPGAPPDAGGWHEASVVFGPAGSIQAAVNGVLVGAVIDTHYSNGWAALGCGWHECIFKDFSLH